MRPIGITMGDPAGIGPEIIAKALAQSPSAPALVVGDAAIMQRAVRITRVDLTVRPIDRPDEARFAPRTIELVRASNLPPDLPFGRILREAGLAAHHYVEFAIELALQDAIGAIVTAPISKEAWKMAGIGHPGHTEILAERTGTRDFAMMLANDELRVLLVTIHVALAEAIKAITVETELRAIRLADAACRNFGVRMPRVAVAGLNPHAGENGMFGREDLDVIAPAVALARQERIEASGPWPPDTVFMRARRGEFDVVVAQYHDQGLIPVKYLGVDSGVNITVGLPFVRTSVDHGTAFDIAGTGKADHASLREAIEQAIALTRARRQPQPSARHGA